MHIFELKPTGVPSIHWEGSDHEGRTIFVRASNEAEAREIVTVAFAKMVTRQLYGDSSEAPWKNPDLASCTLQTEPRFKTDGPAEVLFPPLEHEVGIATTQYCDMMGTAAIDLDGYGLQGVAKLVGVSDEYFPLAVSFTGVTPVTSGRIMESGWPLRLSCIWAAKKAIAGDTGEDIIKYAQSHGDRVPVTRFQIEEKDAEAVNLTELMKRFEVRLTKRMDPYVEPFHLVCDEPD